MEIDPTPEQSESPEEENLPASAGELLPSAAATLERIRAILTRARHRALQTVSVLVVQANWEVGR